MSEDRVYDHSSFVRIPKSLAEMLHTGVITSNEFCILSYMMLQADLRTGIIITSSTELSAQMGLDRIKVRNILSSLKRKRLITHQDTPGTTEDRKPQATRASAVYICDYPKWEQVESPKTHTKVTSAPRQDRQKVTQMPQTTENIETDGNLAIKTEATHKNNNIKNIYKLPPQTSTSESTGGEGDFSKTEEEIKYLAKKLRDHSVKPRKARQLAARYPRDTIFRHIKQIKYDYCSGQRWGDPGAILVHRIQAGKDTPNFGGDRDG